MTLLKHQDGKPMLSHLPARELAQVARVLDHGAAKYSRDNWREGDFHTYCSAALRHVFERMQGNSTDADSGQPALAHAVADLLFCLWFDNQRADNAKPEKPAHDYTESPGKAEKPELLRASVCCDCG